MRNHKWGLRFLGLTVALSVYFFRMNFTMIQAMFTLNAGIIRQYVTGSHGTHLLIEILFLIRIKIKNIERQFETAA